MEPEQCIRSSRAEYLKLQRTKGNEMFASSMYVSSEPNLDHVANPRDLPAMSRKMIVTVVVICRGGDPVSMATTCR